MKLLEKIQFADLDNIPQLIKDFLAGSIEDFRSENFSLQNIEQKIQARKEYFSSEKRSVLSQIFEKQMRTVVLSEKQENHLNIIRDENTFTVTTGHQLNLFTGPVFFIYKILQTLKTSQFLKKKFPEYQFVPVFWMATEDHDFEEINHFKTFGRPYEINEKNGGAVGEISISDTDFIKNFESEFENSVFGTELILMMKEAYRTGNSLAEATRILVNRLFSEFGLLILDGNETDLKRLMISVFKKELNNNSLLRGSKKNVDFLIKNYGKAQVNPRGINLFYLSATRNRIEFDGEKFNIVDTDITFTKNEIEQELHSHPEKFSPNALMRPVYQETVLPNIMYIGGNAEIMYWLQLKDYFKSMQLPFPVLVPRNSMLWITEKTLNKIKKLELSARDFLNNFQKITDQKVLENQKILDNIQRLESLLVSSFSELKNVSELTEKSFGNLVKAEEIRQLKSFQRMKKRLLRAEKRKQHELVSRLQQVYLTVNPSGIWQERVLNFSVFYADEGRAWLETCLEEMDVLHPNLLVLVN